MKRRIAVVMVLAGFLAGGLAGRATGADLKVMHTQNTKDAVVALKSESGQWAQGKNAFVLEFTSAAGQPLDVGKVALSTSMAMPGMAPMIAGATLSPDAGPGRYLGAIIFPDRGTRQVTVTWDGPSGRGLVKFSIPVR